MVGKQAIFSKESFRIVKAWLLPVISVLIAAGLRLSLEPILGPTIPYGLFFLAITVSALSGGFFPGILATFLSSIAVSWLFIDPKQQLLISSTNDLVALCVFGFVGVTISLLGHSAKKARRSAESSAQRLLAVFDNAALGIVETDSEGRFVRINNCFCKMLDYGRERLSALSVYDLTAPEDLSLTRELHEALYSGLRRSLNYEKRYIKSDGDYLWAHVTVAAVRDQSGRLTKLVSTIEDINERKRTETALKESESRFQKLADSMPQVVWASRPDGRVDYYNRKWYEITGAPEGDFEESRREDLIHPEDRAGYRTSWHQSLSTGKPFQVQYRLLHSGKRDYRWNLGLALPIRGDNGDITRWYGTSTDIHDFKMLEEALRQSERNYRIVADNTNAWEFWRGPDGNFIYNSPSCRQITGYSQEELRDDPGLFERMVWQEDRVCFDEHAGHGEEGCATDEAEYRIVQKNGGLRWIQHICRPVYGADGKYLGVRGSNRDITEKKLTEKLVLESEARFRMALEASETGWWHWDFSTDELSGDSRVKALLGLSPDSPISFPIIMGLVHPEDRPVLEERARQLREKEGEYEVEYRVGWPDKSTHWLLVKGKSFDGGGKPSFGMGTATDISERKQAEEERRKLEAQVNQAHKLESIGLLAGGIAHDFNNLLAGLFGHIEVASKFTDKGLSREAQEALKGALDVFDRARSLTRQLLTFSKGGGPARKTREVLPVVRDAATFALSGSNVAADVQAPPDLWLSDIDENQLSQAIDNIIINAKEAMPGGGLIHIKLENIPKGAPLPEPLDPGDYIRLLISDHGPGIPKEAYPHLFEPFFTTKETGHGLGLPIAYSIIRKHGGIIAPDLNVEKGASFCIYLPASKGVRTTRTPEKLSPAPGQGRVLVMDDEESVLEVVSLTLNSLGYVVASAINGEQTIEDYKKSLATGEVFDVVVLDLTIKNGMGGKDAVQELLKIDPKVTAIVSSGYSDDPVMTSPEKFGFAGVIAKPYRSSELGALLKKVIDKKNYGKLRAV